VPGQKAPGALFDREYPGLKSVLMAEYRHRARIVGLQLPILAWNRDMLRAHGWTDDDEQPEAA
jgi:hypothetical protein